MGKVRTSSTSHHPVQMCWLSARIERIRTAGRIRYNDRSLPLRQPALECLEVGNGVRQIVARPRVTRAVHPDRVQSRPACAAHVELDVVSEVYDFLGRTVERAAGGVKEHGVRL